MLKYISADGVFKNLSGILAAAFVLLFANLFQVANAQTDTLWNGGSGNWNDLANWDNGIPVGNFNAIIGSNAGTIIQDVGPFELESMELNGASAEIVLDNLLVVGNFDWQSGTISGNDELNFVGSGQIIDGALETTFNNGGFMQLGSDTEFGLLDSSIGAVWNNQSGSTLEILAGSRIGNFINDGIGLLNIEFNSTFTMAGSSSSINWAVVNEGVIAINDTVVLFLKDYQQSETAHLILNGGTADFFEATEIQGKVSGTGGILNLASTGFDALLEPGGDAIGSFQVGGGLPMTPATVSNFQIGPALSSDLISNIGGPLQLDGTLNIEALPGATTGTYTLFTYNNGSGLTNNIQLGDVPAGFEGNLFLDVPNQSIKLNVQAIDPTVLLGDINQDGSVNLLDVDGFVALLSSGQFQIEADINEDGFLNLLDVSLFVALLAG